MDTLIQTLTNPLVILTIGLITVIGMIIVLRVNAFMALITAAIVVSLLSPGAIAEKIGRVAQAFGGTAAGIGIVIALAAIIGKCLMDSGAADRIVRSFLKVLGEKRASWALTGSGFVLSIPVFFDTVFYLLVPLARSLYRSSRKNYVLYITAIGTGAAITHTLVPPTPGPLLMAGFLNIDLGVMILVGVMIGIPTAIVGLAVCHVINRMMDLPMRPYAGEPEPEILDDDQLPSLWISLAPVLLPVVLISVKTVTDTVANLEHAALFQEDHISDFPAFCRTLTPADPDAPYTPNAGVAQRVRTLLPEETRVALDEANQSADYSDDFRAQMQISLNGLLQDRTQDGKLYDEDAFLGVKLSAPAKKLLGQDAGRMQNAQYERLNRLLLEAAFPDQIEPHFWETPRRRAANVGALLGDANLALLLSAAIAMIVLVRQRGLSLKELAKTTETALMSGGVIILITAAGGAFGGMLKVCGVKETIQGFAATDGANAGVMMLLLGFGVAALLKVAQGSSTVSMIVTSSMLAAMGVSSQMLGFNVVYLATAIGGGSLCGSWMNDSGFWIFSRMGGLTETETLKAWSILLAILGVLVMGFTLLAAWWLPLLPPT